MARIPEHELERIKQEVSVQRLAEACGVELKKAGRDLMGKCIFHDDSTASLSISPAKNVWHCLGCGACGGPIDWVMRTRGLSFRHAVEILRTDPALAASAGAATCKVGTVRTLPTPVTFDADEQALLTQTLDYYCERLKASAAGLAYLKARGIDHPAVIDTFKLGACDRTLGLRLPMKNRVAGATIRERLQAIGILLPSGHERFYGSLVIPIFDEAGGLAEVYGRKLSNHQKPGVAKHMYLRQPEDPGERRPRGVFNLTGIREAGQRPSGEREVILSEALIDALTWWVNGYTQVTSSFGTEGFTAELLQALKDNAIERVYIAYDRDPAGDRAAEELAPKLIAEGFEVLRVLFPPGIDANDYACQVAKQSDGRHGVRSALALLLRQAQWIGTGRPALATAATVTSDELAAKEEKVFPPLAAEAPRVATAPAEAALLPEEVQIDSDACSWRVRGWKKNTSSEVMRVNLQARTAHGGYFVDTLDLYSARSRASFVRAAAIELGMGEEAVRSELGAVMFRLEALQDELILQARQPRTPTAPILSAEEEAKALELLRAPNLLARIVADLHALGMVGEEMNLLAAYLAATSRKLRHPLAVLIQSTSAAGKSTLMDSVLSLMPPEERIRYSAMTGQSLYYLGETNLQHKILAIAEEEGVRQAAYALKLLQSDGELTIASTAKDETTGNLQTRQYTVKGPVMLLLTTTAIDVDEELLNRCLLLSVNESPEQTAAIHAKQRQAQTLEGLMQASEREAVQALHHNAQRLLAPLRVVNPFAPKLTFLAHKTRSRRDNAKYLALIEAITLLHQHQRPLRTREHAGVAQHYIETTLDDIALANAIAHEVLGRTLDELPPQTRKLLTLTRAWVGAQCQAKKIRQSQLRFTRRQLREDLHWGDTQLKVHLARLIELEYLAMHRRGPACEYELLYDAREGQDDGAHVNGLIDPAELDASYQYDPDRSGLQDLRSGSGRPSVGPRSGGGRGGVHPIETRAGIGAAPKSKLNGSKPHKSGGADNTLSGNALL